MFKYVAKRLLLLIPVVIGITLFIYVILSAAPGDPAQLILGMDASEEELVARVAGPGLSPMPLSSCACLPKNRTAPDGLARLVVQYGSLDSEAISAFGAELSRALA